MENRRDNASKGKTVMASCSIKTKEPNGETGGFSNGGILIPLSRHDYQQQIFFGENKRLVEALENANREIDDKNNQLRTAQELIDTQRKYVQEAETNVKKLRQVEEENKELRRKLEEQKELRKKSDDLAVKLQRFLLEFTQIPPKKTPKLLELEAKLSANSIEDKLFDSNIDVIFKQLNSFCGSLKTSLNILKNHQKEKREDIENTVRKLVKCCYGNSVGESKAIEDGDSSDADAMDNMEISGDAKYDMDTSEDVIVTDDGGISGEDKVNSYTCGDGNNDSGVSCFDPIELDDEPETVEDSPILKPEKPIRERRPSSKLRDYLVPKETLKIHFGQKERHSEKSNDNSIERRSCKRKNKKKGTDTTLIGPLSCKMCDKRFKNAKNLKRHIECHNMCESPEDSVNKRKICYRCGKFFENKELLNLHRNVHHQENSEEKPQG